MKSTTRLFQIQNDKFTAGFCVDKKNLVWRAAPILAWLEEKPLYFVDSYCKKRGWKLISLGTVDEDAARKASMPV